MTRGSIHMAKSPTLRRRRLSRLLRELRETNGMTSTNVTHAAEKLGGKWSRGKLTRIEKNEWTRPDPKDVMTLLDIYEVTDEATRESYWQLAKQARQRGWWVGYSDVLGKGAYVGLEAEASRIRTYGALLIPGLLQTREYARVASGAGGFAEEGDIERYVEARMMRKQILVGDPAPRIWAIIDEAALRKIPEEVRKGQIKHLIDVQRPDLRVQILRDSAGLHAAITGSFVILDFAEDPPAVYREDLMSSVFYEEPGEIAHCEVVYDHVHASALSVEDSQAFLRDMLSSE